MICSNLIYSFKSFCILYSKTKHLFQLVVAGVRWKVDPVEAVRREDDGIASDCAQELLENILTRCELSEEN